MAAAKGKTVAAASAPGYLELAFCVAGIYACFLTWGITQERVSTTTYEGKAFKYFVFLNLAQVGVCPLGSAVC